REKDFAAIEAAGAFPELPTEDLAEGSFEGGPRHFAKLGDGDDPAFAEQGSVGVADAVKFFDGQRIEKGFFVAGSDEAEAAGAFETRSDRSDSFGARGTDAGAEAGSLKHIELHATKRARIVRVEALGAGEVEIEIVEGGGFDDGRVGFEDAADALGVVGVVFVLAGDDDGFGAEAQGFAEGHSGLHAEEFGFITGGSDHAAANKDGLAAQLGIQDLLDGSEESVHVHMDDIGDFFDGSRGMRMRLRRHFLEKGTWRQRNGREGNGGEYGFDTVDRSAVTQNNVHRAPVREAGAEIQRVASGS